MHFSGLLPRAEYNVIMLGVPRASSFTPFEAVQDENSSCNKTFAINLDLDGKSGI